MNLYIGLGPVFRLLEACNCLDVCKIANNLVLLALVPISALDALEVDLSGEKIIALVLILVDLAGIDIAVLACALCELNQSSRHNLELRIHDSVILVWDQRSLTEGRDTAEIEGCCDHCRLKYGIGIGFLELFVGVYRSDYSCEEGWCSIAEDFCEALLHCRAVSHVLECHDWILIS